MARIGAIGILKRSLKKNLETIPGKHSIDSLQKTAILGTSHIIRKVLQCEAWSLSGGDHRWFKRSTRKKCLWQETYILYNNNSCSNIIVAVVVVVVVVVVVEFTVSDELGKTYRSFVTLVSSVSWLLRRNANSLQLWASWTIEYNHKILEAKEYLTVRLRRSIRNTCAR